MRTRVRLVGTIVLLAALGPGCGPGLTPEQLTQKLRLSHEIVPVGFNTIRDAEGRPSLIVDLRVTNRGTDPLPHLTVLVQLRAPDGTITASKRVTLDLAGARPGVGVQVAATLPGVEAGPEDQVTVELESGLSDEAVRTLPEYRDVAAGMKGS